MRLRLAMIGDIVIIDADQAYKRMQAHNMQLAYLGYGDLTQRLAAFDSFFDGAGSAYANREDLQKQVNASVAHQAFWAASAAFDLGHLEAFERLLSLAVELLPDLRTRPDWRRFQWKRRLGTKTWSVVGPMVTRLRPMRAR